MIRDLFLIALRLFCGNAGEYGPTVIERDRATGVVTYEEWQREGRLHREDGPAIILRDPAPRPEVVYYEEWWREGQLHREDGPAVIECDPATGVIWREQWWLNGERQEPPQRAPAPGGPRP